MSCLAGHPSRSVVFTPPSMQPRQYPQGVALEESKLAHNRQVIDTWVAQADLPSGGPGAVTLTYRAVTTGVPLAPGDIITLEDREQSSEYARVDKVDFVLVDDGL
jgi:hypothetical protein